MGASEFLPAFPPAVGAATILGLVLVVGVCAGELSKRYLRLPRLSGYLIAGLLLGPQFAALVDLQLMRQTDVLIDIAIGLVLYELGHRLDLKWFRHNRWFLVVAIAEIAFTFAAVFVTLRWLDYRPMICAMIAAVSVSTSPAVVVMLTRELGADGQVTERLLSLTAVNSVAAAILVIVLLPWVHLQQRAELSSIVFHPAYVLFGSLAAGALAHGALAALARWLGKREELQYVLMVGAVVLLVGLTRALHLSVVLSLLVFGICSRNLDSRHSLLPVHFGHGGLLFLVLLLFMSGASLRLLSASDVLLVTLALLVARWLGKALGVMLFSRLSGLGWMKSAWLALALLPAAEVALLTAHDARALYPDLGNEIAALVIPALAVLALAGPVATQFALRRAGEVSGQPPNLGL